MSTCPSPQPAVRRLRKSRDRYFEVLMKFWIRFCALAILLLQSLAFAQRGYDPTKPCNEGQRRQFDFWLGSWDVTWPASSHGPAGSGRDAVQKILANCAVQENFVPDASGLRATSILTYVPETGQWKQIWVDNEGHSRDLTGESKNGEVVLSGQ